MVGQIMKALSQGGITNLRTSQIAKRSSWNPSSPNFFSYTWRERDQEFHRPWCTWRSRLCSKNPNLLELKPLQKLYENLFKMYLYYKPQCQPCHGQICTFQCSIPWEKTQNPSTSMITLVLIVYTLLNVATLIFGHDNVGLTA